MKTKTMMIWGVGAAAVVGLGLAMVGTARASDDTEGTNDDGGSGNTDDSNGPVAPKVRHGIQHEGCDHFELVDPDAIEAWGRDNAWRFSKWILSLDELRADPEPAIVDAMELLFPECTWPPPPSTTFQAERLSWTEAMAMAKEAAANMDLAPAPGQPSLASTAAFVGLFTTLAFRGVPGGGQPR